MRDLSPWRSNQPPAEVMHTSPMYRVSGEEEVHVRDYLNVIRQRFLLVILVALAVFSYGAYKTLSATPKYTATATLRIEPQNPTVPVGSTVPGIEAAGGGLYDYYQTQFTLLEKSRPLAARVVAELGLQSNPDFLGRENIPSFLDRFQSWLSNLVSTGFSFVSRLWLSVPTPEEEHSTVKEESLKEESPSDGRLTLGVDPYLVDRYLGFLRVSPVRNTRLVEVRFTTPDPTLSSRLANAHASGFIHMNIETRFELTKEAREFLEKKLGEIRSKVERSEGALQDFRKTYGVVSVEGGENIVVDRLVDLNKRLTEARARRIELESLYRMMNENKNSAYLSNVVNNSTIQALRTNLNTLEAEQAQLATIFKPDHPRLQQLSEQIREARQRLDREIVNVFRGVQSDYDAARAREEALQANAEHQQQDALNLKGLGIKYIVLQQEVESNRTLYKNLLDRLNETTVSNATAVSNIELAQLAETPQTPSFPQTKRDLLVAGILGALLGVGLAFVTEYFDSTMHTAEDVWRVTGVPTLAVVPDLNSLRHRMYAYTNSPAPVSTRRLTHPGGMSNYSFSQELMAAHYPLSIISESYRSLRAALLLSQVEHLPRVMLITSAAPADGKTITTLNLGIALAQSGYKVVVVDADLRKGCCHRLLNRQNHRGLSNVLTGALKLEESVQETGVSGFYLLPRGAILSKTILPNPADLLGSGEMKEIVEALRERFDFVLIDSPPALVMSDALVLSPLCDGVLVVLRGEKTTADNARQLVGQLEAVHAKILGIVMNGVNVRGPAYAYYRKHYQTYYRAMDENKE